MQQILLNTLLFKQKNMSSWIYSNSITEFTNQTQRLLLYSPQNVLVHSSCFQDLTLRNEGGGAICMKTSCNRTILFVKYSNFHNCTSDGAGGSIFQSQ